MIGIDLFAGAGGMTLGAKLAGIKVTHAVEIDPHAAATYKKNHPEVVVFEKDIRTIQATDFGLPKGEAVVLFGGPPCQGFSTANQRTRSAKNPQNWLFREFLRIVRGLKPNWVVFENVKGISETEDGVFLQLTISDLKDAGYTISSGILNLLHFGGAQDRSRIFIIGSKHNVPLDLPIGKSKGLSIKEALADLPKLTNGATKDLLRYRAAPKSSYAKRMRKTLSRCSGHLVTKNADYVLKRYKYIKQGGNWEQIPAALMRNYADRSRCHTGIYYRLAWNEPSIVIGNYRKNMLIHPLQDRGLSVREAARLQSFPDSYEFTGTIGFKQQQVGNAVPPLLAKAVFQKLLTAKTNAK